MLLKDLLPNFCGSLSDVEIAGITSDSREIKQGFAFVCIKGVANDGHKFAATAADLGAVVVITEHDMPICALNGLATLPIHLNL